MLNPHAKYASFSESLTGRCEFTLHQPGYTDPSSRASMTGMSSGAPAQDHYTFQNSKEITDLEFPLGKKAHSGYFWSCPRWGKL